VIKRPCVSFAVSGIMYAYLSVACVLSILPAHASEERYPGAGADSVSFFSDRERGWFWYEQLPPPEEKRKKEHKLAHPFPPETLEDARRQLTELKEEAVMHPTEANLAAYIRLQNWVNDKSEQFSHAWKKVIWRHPELDYSIEHSTDARAILVRKDTEVANHRSRMAAIGRTYGLFFIFRSTCPYCHREAPMLKRFARRYGISVIPISQDGPGLPDYPHPRPDTGISAQLGIQTVPALLLVNPKRRDIIPIAYGLVSEQELIQRITTLTAHINPSPKAGYSGNRR